MGFWNQNSPFSLQSATNATGNGGFTIDLVDDAYAGSDQLIVSIKGNISFKGFLLYAVSANGTRVGQFQEISSHPVGAKPKSCGGVVNSTITHNNPRLKQPGLFFRWIAPSNGSSLISN